MGQTNGGHSALRSPCPQSWKQKQVVVGIFDGLLVKYWTTITGYCAVMSPFILDLPHVRNKKTEEITRDQWPSVPSCLPQPTP